MPPAAPANAQLAVIATDLLTWYRANRRDLPWRRERDPYRIWISEIMLQQTQVTTAIPYYHRFIDRFPTLADLARADADDVLRAWQGLGYYSRARNLHTAVREVQEKYGGEVPRQTGQLRSLKGVGEYTAGAIASIAYNRSEPAVDGNVLRVISRLFSLADDIGLPSARRRITEIVRQMIPDGEASDFTQALMELGALICSPTSASCESCPVRGHCQASAEGSVAMLPVNQKRAKVTTETMMVVVWMHEGRLAVEKRPDQGLLARQWQMPMIQMEQADLAEAIQMFIERYSQGAEAYHRELGAYPYQFSHRRWEQCVVALSATPRETTPFSWYTLSEIEQMHLITAHRRILEKCRLAPLEQSDPN